jgi:hypothetical protein
MPIADFLRALVEHGRVRVARFVPGGGEDQDGAAVDAVLNEWDAANRLEFPGAAPTFDRSAARWAAEQLYRASQFAVFRDVDANTIQSKLGAACPSASPAASVHYSVDLAFRFLPDLLRHAAGVSRADPLCDQLRAWGGQWPLSSVGMPDVQVASIDVICGHAGLLRLYIDRIVVRSDVSRLADPRVRAALQAALGHYPDLAPGLTAALAGAKSL